MQTRKILSLFLALALLFGLTSGFPLRAQAAETVNSGTCGDNLTWTLDDDGVFTISGSGKMTGYYSVNDVPWYSCRTQIVTVVIKSGITSIGYNSFHGCTGLKSVTIPYSITSIGTYAFANCTSLKTISIPDSVTNISDGAFNNCTAMTSITLSNSLSDISESLFYHCTRLRNIIIPNSAASIGDYAFYGCSNLSSVTIGSKVSSIGYMAFENCSNLATIFIPGNVTSIGAYSFRGCKTLANVTLGEGVASISELAFNGCSGLVSINLPATVTNIGYSAFDGCSNLASIAIPDNITSMGSYAFRGCTSLTSVDIGESASIGSGAFSGCTSLTNVTIGSKVASIPYGVFSGCSSLKTIVIPDSVTSIGEQLFENCTSLTSVIVGKKVSSIANYTFRGCKSLTNVSIGNRVTSIGQCAFTGCSSLSTITIPDSVTHIGGLAFEYCSSLATITIPDSITNIYGEAFYGCRNLMNVYYTGDKESWEEIIIGSGNSSLTNATIHYNSVPLTISKQPKSQSVKADTTVSFAVTASGNGLKYQWQYRTSTIGNWKNSSADSATTRNFSVKATTARNGYQYRCKITDSEGKAVYSDIVTLTVTGVTITTQPKTQNVKADATAKFTVKATGNGLKYQWQYRTSSSGSWKNSGASSATTKTFSVKGTTARNGYQYRCKVTDSAGNTVYTKSATLYVLGITTQPKTTTVANNATAKFTVKATGNGLKYQWQYRTSSSGSWKNSGATSATSKTFSVKGTSDRNGYQYRCKITDSAGNVVYSSTVTLKVSAASITTQPKSVTVANGKTAKFTVKTSGSGLKFQWQYRTSASGSWKNSGASSATSKTFSVKGTYERDAYQYRCRITDKNGNVIYTNTVTLTVN